MRRDLDDFLTLRLSANMRDALRGEARAADVNVSVIARNALAVCLGLIRDQESPDNDGMPPRTPPAAPMRAAA